MICNRAYFLFYNIAKKIQFKPDGPFLCSASSIGYRFYTASTFHPENNHKKNQSCESTRRSKIKISPPENIIETTRV